MKKALLIILLFLFITTSFSCSSQKSNTEDANIEYTYLPQTIITKSENKSGFSQRRKTKYKYDAYGNITKEELFTKELFYVRDWCFDYNYTYDEYGKIIKEATHKEYFSTNITDEHYEHKEAFEYQYDSNGKLVKKNVIDSPYPITSYNYEYDELGNLTKEFHASTISPSSIEYFYNPDNTLSKKVENDKTYTYEYNTQGQLISVKIDSIYNTYTHQTYQYDNNGNNIYSRKISYNLEGEISTCTDYFYNYDELGRLIKEEWHDLTAEGEKSSWSIKEYKDFVKISINNN